MTARINCLLERKPAILSQENLYIGGDNMTKPEAYPVDIPNAPKRTKNNDDNLPEPLSGSKKVKNQNHTGQRHGEGS